MATPEWIEYYEYTHGVNVEGYDDIFNRANRDIWDNFCLEHQKDGVHKTPVGLWAVETDTYTGNGVDDRNITLTNANLDVKYVRIYADQPGTQPGDQTCFKTEHMAGDTTRESYTLAFAANLIQSVGTGTFQIGSADNVNKNAVEYHYLVYGPDY